ncbi:hypothetical protein HF086_012893 [Spodoptera exigua]|uniref:Uncharacterized protein n=1 Tax=Spodoptera exigua TaxID=7107 RepID=A0A922SMW9_SPOEX|nr:hypothetical protein HF086_012893 [Spodoptera exigua]
MANTYNEWRINAFTTQTYFNSKQRREVADIVNVIKFHENDSTVAYEPQVITTQNHSIVQNTSTATENTTVPLQTETTTEVTTVNQTKSELSWIAGPEIYNIEDLANFIEKTENVKLIEEILKKEKDSYDFHDKNELIETASHDEKVLLNDTQVLNSTGVSEVPSNAVDYEDLSFTVVDPKVMEDITYLYPASSKIYFDDVLSSTSVNKLDDANTSDSETGSGSSSGSGSGDGEDDDTEKRPDFSNLTEYFYNDPIDPETVRRDLRGSSDTEQATPRVNKVISNTESKGGNPLYSLLQFMPSLSDSPKDYSSTASRAIPSLVIVLALCL